MPWGNQTLTGFVEKRTPGIVKWLLVATGAGVPHDPKAVNALGIVAQPRATSFVSFRNRTFTRMLSKVYVSETSSLVALVSDLIVTHSGWRRFWYGRLLIGKLYTAELHARYQDCDMPVARSAKRANNLHGSTRAGLRSAVELGRRTRQTSYSITANVTSFVRSIARLPIHVRHPESGLNPPDRWGIER
jgi:hypothetical protein